MNRSIITAMSLLVAGTTLPQISSAFTVSGSAVSVAGNSGNPASSTPTVTTNHAGTISSGVITGAGNVAPVPLPTAMWSELTALLALAGLARRKRRA
jgi:hypothetical protein